MYSFLFPPDVDECLFGMCKNGKCVNTKGSFKCICDIGFDVDALGKACEGMDLQKQVIWPIVDEVYALMFSILDCLILLNYITTFLVL